MRTILFLIVILSIPGLSLLAQKASQVQDMDAVQHSNTFMHRRAEQGGLRLELRGIYLRHGLLWLSFQARNRSPIDFRIDWMSFSIFQRHQFRRTAIQEIRILPVIRREPSLIASDSVAQLCYGLTPRVLSREKEMRVELREWNGDRRIRLVISSKELLRARKLP